MPLVPGAVGAQGSADAVSFHCVASSCAAAGEVGAALRLVEWPGSSKVLRRSYSCFVRFALSVRCAQAGALTRAPQPHLAQLLAAAVLSRYQPRSLDAEPVVLAAAALASAPPQLLAALRAPCLDRLRRTDAKESSGCPSTRPKPECSMCLCTAGLQTSETTCEEDNIFRSWGSQHC